LGGPLVVDVYLAESATGLSLVTTVPDGGIAAAAGKSLGESITDAAIRLLSDVNGIIAFTITESTAKSFYPFLVLPTGEVLYLGEVAFV
jgi:hypothetical protein